MYDIIVIGGGINGAGIAREAARHGYATLLLERDDFGWGTTWRSTKLIHGGLRYLEHGEVGLVFESLRDRARLLREYPDMVRPLSFLLPIYENDRHGPITVGAGLTLYDLLAHARSLPVHRRLNRPLALEMEPSLRRRGLAGAFTYSDSQVAYPERLCIQTVLEARAAGADVRNHAEVVDFIVERGRVAGVSVRATLSGAAFEVRAPLTVNAAGPWVDALLDRLDRRPGQQLGGTKGAHIVVDLHGRGPLHTVYAETRSDHRPFFVIPWRDHHLVGTTDTRFAGDPDAIGATADDIYYLAAEAAALLPGAALTEGDILYGYAGVRPLPSSTSGSEGAITRRHIIRDHGADGHPGLISIIGGKLSTFRNLSAEVVAQIQRAGFAATVPSTPPAGSADTCAPFDPASPADPALLDYLRQLYGPGLPNLLQLLRCHPELHRPLCSHGPDIEAQVHFAAQIELAETLSDALLRRTGVGWNRCHGLDCAARAAAIMAGVLGWSAQRQIDEIAAYRRQVERTFRDVGRRSNCDEISRAE